MHTWGPCWYTDAEWRVDSIKYGCHILCTCWLTQVITTVGTDHPSAPPTKKRISTTTPTNLKGSANNSTRTPQTPPEANFLSSWLWIDLPKPTPNPSQYSHKDILLALQTFSFVARQIDPFLSFLPIFEASKHLPLTNNSNFPTSVYILKHYLKPFPLHHCSKAIHQTNLPYKHKLTLGLVFPLHLFFNRSHLHIHNTRP